LVCCMDDEEIKETKILETDSLFRILDIY